MLPFLVGTFFYSRNWIRPAVAAMVVALAATLIWRFALKVPGDFSPGLFGFLVAVATLLLTYPLTRHLPLGPWLTPGRGTASEEIN